MNTSAHRPRLFPIVIGNIMEWYDFALYGFFATAIASHFFPAADHRASLLASAATFGVAFLMRPLGAVAFGALGDRFGRKMAMMMTILLMAVGTAMIAFAPTYATAGIGATIILVLGRLLQGFSAAGEAGVAISMVIESSTPQRRGIAAAWFAIGMYGAVVLGSLSALAVNSLLGAQTASDWGWRLPFIAGLLIVPIGLYARQAMLESDEFVQYKEKQRIVGKQPARLGFAGVAKTMGLTAFGTGSLYLLLVFMPAYAEHELGMQRQQAMLSTFLASLLLALLLIPFGWLSDRIGRRPMVAGASLVAGVSVVPLFMHANYAPSFAALIALQASLSVCMAAYASSATILIACLFSVERRAMGVGVGYNLGILLFGAFAPLITGWLIGATGSKLVTAWYVTGVAVLTFIVSLRVPEPLRADGQG